MKPPVVVCLAVAMLLASGASAQSRADQPHARTSSEPGLKLSVTLWAAAAAADQMTTYQFASQYREQLRESNPLIRGLDQHPLQLVAAGTALDVATGWAAYRFLAPKHPRLAKILFLSAAAYRAYLAGHNLQSMRHAEGVRQTTGVSGTLSLE